MNRIDDETLIAFADGELAPGRRRAVEAALAGDAGLRARLALQQRVRSRVAAHYAPVAEEAPPDRVASLLSDRSAEETNVVSLAGRSRSRARPVWQDLTALAATLVLGLFAGTMIPRGDAPVAVENGAMLARGPLGDALETQLASGQTRGEDVLIGVTFAAADGRVCRTFDAAALSGLACREGGNWRVVAAASGAQEADAQFRQASSGKRLVLEAAQAMMSGEPFDPQTERRVHDSGWRNPSAGPD